MPEGLFLQGDLLGVRAEPARGAGGGRSVGDDGGLVPGRHGVVDDACEVGIGPGEQRGEHAGVVLHPHRHRQRRLDGAAGQLVPERQVPVTRAPASPAARCARPASTPRSSTTARARGSSTPEGTTDSCSSAARSAGPSRCTRASTASTTVAGTRASVADPVAAASSETKNGLPAVSRKSGADVAAVPPTSRATAARESRAGPAGAPRDRPARRAPAAATGRPPRRGRWRPRTAGRSTTRRPM